MNKYLPHRVIAGQRWDSLAWSYYGDAARYEPILRANPELRDAAGRWPLVPPAGERVLIPILAPPAAPPVTGRPPWL